MNSTYPTLVEVTEHPDIVGGIVWSKCEIDWINAYGKRCYNAGNADGMRAGAKLFDDTILVNELAMHVRRLARATRLAVPLLQTADAAMDFLKRHDLAGETLRERESVKLGADGTAS